MPKYIDKTIYTDVLVIGGGGAGITAAVAASREGVDVTIVSKGKVANSGNTIMIGGTYSMDGQSAYENYGYSEADKNFSKDVLYESIVKDSFYLSDQNIVKQFVEDSPKIVAEVASWVEAVGQKSMFFPPAMWFLSGRALGKGLRHGLRKEDNVTEINDVLIVELIKAEDKVIGAIGVEVYSGDIIRFIAKSVVIATGGFQPHKLKNTNSDMTGDGIAMAYRAGCEISDMEFLLFLITALEPHEIKGSIFPMIAVAICDDYNECFFSDKDGVKIDIPDEMVRILKASELCKLIHLYYFGNAIFQGRGTENEGIYFDFSEFTDERIQAIFDDLEITDYLYIKGFYHGDDLMEYKKVLLENKRIETGLGNEYTVGGIVINENMETNVKGIYAAGECASGCFGSNRVADATVEMLVQGFKAGENAAKYASAEDFAKGDFLGEDIAEEILSYLNHKDGISAKDANLEIERISSYGISYVRTENLLTKAINEYELLEKKLSNVTVKSNSRRYNFEWIQAIQAKNRLFCAKACAVMAKERKESRGLHIRDDYKLVDNENYLHRTIASNKDNELSLKYRKPIEVDIPLPKPEKMDFIEYILKEDMGLENIDI